VTHESGNTRDQLSTVFDTLIPRGFLGWGNVSTLGFSLAAGRRHDESRRAVRHSEIGAHRPHAAATLGAARSSPVPARPSLDA
jgi:hypothetical protein